MNDIPQEVIDKYRGWNVHDGIDWWDGVYEQFIEAMKEKGIDTDAEHIWFRGFWSQGDGASFAGSIGNAKFFAAHPELLDSHPHHKQMVTLDADEDFSMQVRQSDNRYVHENTMGLTLMYDAALDDHFDMAEPLAEWAYNALDKGIDDELLDFEKDVLELLRGYAKKLYCDLETEHDYLTSDEAVKEAIDANELWAPEQEAA